LYYAWRFFCIRFLLIATHINRKEQDFGLKSVILYEDQDILVCYKPAGFAVQSARASQMDMESELRGYLHGGGLYVVHRLDQPVEGILVFAKNRSAAAKLGAQMQDDVMNKYYRALICGEMPETEGVLIDQIAKKENGVTKHAELSYRIETYNPDMDVSDVRICLKTGRFHQIRIQFSRAGHPLVGDRRYGDERAQESAAALGLKNVALCAERLSFIHPQNGKEMDFSTTPQFHKT